MQAVEPLAVQLAVGPPGGRLLSVTFSYAAARHAVLAQVRVPPPLRQDGALGHLAALAGAVGPAGGDGPGKHRAEMALPVLQSPGCPEPTAPDG